MSSLPRDIWQSDAVILSLRRVLVGDEHARISLEARPGTASDDETWMSMCLALMPTIDSLEAVPRDQFSITWRDDDADRPARVTDVTSSRSHSAIEATVVSPLATDARLVIEWPAAGIADLVVLVDPDGRG